MRIRACMRVGLAVFACIACVPASAESASGRGAPCEPLGSSVRKEPLSQLLRELAAVRRFRLENQIADDPIITHTGGNDVALMAALSKQVNLVVRYAASKDCPGQWRVAAIWILPGLPDAVTPSPAASPALPLPSAADLAAAKQATDMYLRGHGGASPADAASAAPR
jgi:hypothetical protein